MVGGRECAGRLPGTRRIGPCNGTVQPLKTNALKRGIRRYAVAEAMQDGDAPHRYRHGVVLHDRCGLTTPERVAAHLLDVPLRATYIALSVVERSLMTSWSTPCIGRAYTPLPPLLDASLTTGEEPLSKMRALNAEAAVGPPWPCRTPLDGGAAAAHICRGGRERLAMIFEGSE